MVIGFSCAVLLTVFSQGILTAPAIAAPHLRTAPLMAAASNPAEQAKSALDSMVGSGTSEQLEGKADQAAGSVQRAVGKVTGQAEGAAKQAQGKAKEDIGTTKSALEDAGKEAQSASESMIDNVKEFFGQ